MLIFRKYAYDLHTYLRSDPDARIHNDKRAAAVWERFVQLAQNNFLCLDLKPSNVLLDLGPWCTCSS